MKASYAVSLGLGLGGLMLGGFSFGYYFHMNTEMDRFARETDRTPDAYGFRLAWISPAEGGGHPAVLADLREGDPAPLQARTRWHWALSNPAQPCDPPPFVGSEHEDGGG